MTKEEKSTAGKVIPGMTVSLDGFINDRNGSLDRLYPDLTELRESAILQETIRMAGAVVITHSVPEKLPRDSGETRGLVAEFRD